MKKAAKKPSSPSLKKYTFSHPHFIAFILIFATIGGYVIWHSFALTPPSPPNLTSASTTYNMGTNVTKYVVLSWATPTSGSPITGYKIYRAPTPGTEGTIPIATVGPFNVWTDITTNYQTTYYYKITAISADGESTQSNEQSATTGFTSAGFAQLDNATCGTNLQIGSDKTMSSSNKPSFLLAGNGGRSSYTITIDGNQLPGTFTSDGFANVCITTTTVLSDGYHQLTGNELAPSPNTVAPFDFLVDTIPPATPSVPQLASFSDSGVVGDNITKFKGITLVGTTTELSTNNVGIHETNGSLVGGSSVNHTTGAWSASTTPLSDGLHSIDSQGYDMAGNVSVRSAPTDITIDSTAPSGTITSPANGATVGGTVNVSADPTDSLSGIWKVDFQVDGVTKSTDTTAPYSYSWDTTGLTDGSSHTLTAIIHDVADNTLTTSSSVVVQSGGGGPIPGDANGDGHVSQADLTIFAANFGGQYVSFCDFNNDQKVDFLDLSIILTHYGS